MPQQINLCAPILLTQKRYFSALTMVQALAVFMVLGGGLSAYWVWSLNALSAGYQQNVTVNAGEIQRLQAAIQASKARTGPVDAALTQELQARRTELMQREQLLEELRRGLLRDGRGHSARLQLVAQSIPAQVWVTEVKADDRQFELSGFTLEPAALNEWVGKLSSSPLLQGQKLSTVKVERTGADIRNGVVQKPPAWSFTLVSAVAVPAVPASGVKP